MVMRVWSSILSCASREVGVAIALGQCDATMTAMMMSQRIIDVRAELTTLVSPGHDKTPPAVQSTGS
jgi:hypothetical protein